MSPAEISALSSFGEKWATEFEKNFIPDPTAQVPTVMTLQHLAVLHGALNQRMAEHISRALGAGVSWEMIGGALGISAELAQQRYESL